MARVIKDRIPNAYDPRALELHVSNLICNVHDHLIEELNLTNILWGGRRKLEAPEEMYSCQRASPYRSQEEVV